MNRFIAIGYVATDIGQSKATPESQSYLRFNLAVKKDFKNKDGEYDTDFLPFTCFGVLADTISKYVIKGQQLAVEGRATTYTEVVDNKNYTRVNFIADKITFIGKKVEEKPQTNPSDFMPYGMEQNKKEELKINTPNNPYIDDLGF